MEKILNIAHRGARSLAPENTLAAARKAVEAGAHMWELDVRLSADGIPVVIHDQTLERTSNISTIPAHASRAPWFTHTFTLAEMRSLDFGSWFQDTDPFGQIAAGAVSPDDLSAYIGQEIPTLEEALVFTREHGLGVNVEIKDLSGLPGEREIVARVAGVIKKFDLDDQVIISSFNFDYMKWVKEELPGIRTGLIVDYQPSEPIELLKSLGAAAFHPAVTVIDPPIIELLRKKGFLVNVWTVNDMETMKMLITAGASGLITDFPQTAGTALSQAGAISVDPIV